jgi:hypothetical protein
VTDDEIEPKSYSLLSEYFTNEKIEVGFFFGGGGPSAYSGRYAEVLCLLTSWLLLLILHLSSLEPPLIWGIA